MIDLTETIDRMFEAGPGGTQLRFAIFDKSVLLPLPQLLDAASDKQGDHSEANCGSWRVRVGSSTTRCRNDGTRKARPSTCPTGSSVHETSASGYTTDELRVIADFESF